MINCKELFLQDIVEISLHPVQGCQLPVPFSVSGITEMNNCVLSAPVLRIGYNETIVTAAEGSLSAKCTTEVRSFGMQCVFDVAAIVDGECPEIHTLYNNINDFDHYICLTKSDGSKYLVYTLPGSSRFLAPTTISGSEQRQVSISAKAASEFINITLR